MTAAPTQSYPLGALVICPDNRPGCIIATQVTCNGRPMLGVRVDDGQKCNAVIFVYVEQLRASEVK